MVETTFMLQKETLMARMFQQMENDLAALFAWKSHNIVAVVWNTVRSSTFSANGKKRQKCYKKWKVSKYT